MRKTLLLLAAGAMCVAALGSGTLAYFTLRGQSHNVITTGAVQIRLREWQDTENGLVPYPQEAVRVMPGMQICKIATVENAGVKAYIRAKTETVITDREGNVLDLPREELEQLLSLEGAREDWLQKPGEEWWYYAYALETGAATAPLFTQVTFHGSAMTEAYENCTVEIRVLAQGVQTANNGSSVMEAAGWPEGQEGEEP